MGAKREKERSHRRTGGVIRGTDRREARTREALAPTKKEKNLKSGQREQDRRLRSQREHDKGKRPSLRKKNGSSIGPEGTRDYPIAQKKKKNRKSLPRELKHEGSQRFFSPS